MQVVKEEVVDTVVDKGMKGEGSSRSSVFHTHFVSMSVNAPYVIISISSNTSVFL